MTTEANSRGLSRYIPAAIKREIRQRSRFGCVLCRVGFYTYEHISPLFKDAEEHDPAAMCCLCWKCQDAVTRGHISKEAVLRAYTAIQAAQSHNVKPPIGPLDFHEGDAQILIGGISYYPAVRTLLRYDGVDLIRVTPASKEGEAGAISAVFTDDSGREVLRLDENEWIGSTAAWDIDVVGARITVRRNRGHIVLQLRLDPPGRIVVERLDMRFKDAHVLATANSYAVGRYIADGTAQWICAKVYIMGSELHGAAIEFASRSELIERSVASTGDRKSAEAACFQVVGGVGAMLMSHGISIGSGCSLAMMDCATGQRLVSDMRKVLIEDPESVPMFIASGRTR